MSANVVLNLFNELGKRYKMRGLPRILSLFRNELNKFNYTGARMLDSIYHMYGIKLLNIEIFGVKTSRVFLILRKVVTWTSSRFLKIF